MFAARIRNSSGNSNFEFSFVFAIKKGVLPALSFFALGKTPQLSHRFAAQLKY